MKLKKKLILTLKKMRNIQASIEKRESNLGLSIDELRAMAVGL